MSDLPCRHRHFGVYGVCVVEDHVLLVRKARGPYTGLWDLPGGGIEFGEEPEAALRCEFIEETGVTIENLVLVRAASHLVRYVNDSGAIENLHHVGLIYKVAVQGYESADVSVRSELPCALDEPDGEDSGGAVWTRLDSLRDNLLTPFARLMVFDRD